MYVFRKSILEPISKTKKSVTIQKPEKKENKK